MRRKENEITDQVAMHAMIHRAKVCRLAMLDGDQPYVVPLCFGYVDNTLYFHTAAVGLKVEILRKNPKVCFEIDWVTKVDIADSPCESSVEYQSVIGFGRAVFLADPAEKIQALHAIMTKYSDRSFQIPDTMVDKTTVIKVEIDRMTGKQSKSLS